MWSFAGCNGTVENVRNFATKTLCVDVDRHRYDVMCVILLRSGQMRTVQLPCVPAKFVSHGTEHLL